METLVAIVAISIVGLVVTVLGIVAIVFGREFTARVKPKQVDIAIGGAVPLNQAKDS